MPVVIEFTGCAWNSGRKKGQTRKWECRLSCGHTIWIEQVESPQFRVEIECSRCTAPDMNTSRDMSPQEVAGWPEWMPTPEVPYELACGHGCTEEEIRLMFVRTGLRAQIAFAKDFLPEYVDRLKAALEEVQ